MEIRISGTQEEIVNLLNKEELQSQKAKSACTLHSAKGVSVTGSEPMDEDCRRKKMESRWLRFEPIGTVDEVEEMEAMLIEKGLTRQDLARILFSLRVRPGFQRSDFGI